MATSYVRARAEGLVKECRAGFWERGERIVYILIGLGAITALVSAGGVVVAAPLVGLLGIIGIKMIVEAIRKKDGAECIQFDKLTVLLSLSLATSIDALIVGMSFAILRMNIVLAITIIGLTSAVFTMIGIGMGKRYGWLFGKKAEIIGGIVLIGIGIKILIEHLFCG